MIGNDNRKVSTDGNQKNTHWVQRIPPKIEYRPIRRDFEKLQLGCQWISKQVHDSYLAVVQAWEVRSSSSQKKREKNKRNSEFRLGKSTEYLLGRVEKLSVQARIYLGPRSHLLFCTTPHFNLLTNF